MSEPCENCGSDLKVCVSCDFYNDKYIRISVLEQIRTEIASYKDDKVIHAERNEMIDIVLAIIDKYTKGDRE